MRKKINKIATVFIVSIFALSGLGTAYAMWSDTVTIHGTIETGTVEWEFAYPITVTDLFCPLPYYPTPTPDWNCDPDLGFNGPYPQPYLSDKNVGCGEAFLIDSHTIEFNIYNVYPGYYNHLDFWVHGLGTIPIKIDSVVFTDASGNQIGYLKGAPGSVTLMIAELDLNGDTYPDAQVEWGDNWGAQLHHCDKADISFGICFLQPLPQDEIITLYIHLRAVQWNEYTYP